ncbi:MAG: hypothetical protein ACREOB_04070 [Thermodesulfobacteriota bacterium]
MNTHKQIGLVDLCIEIDDRLKQTVCCFLEALQYIDGLYHLQDSDEFSPALEHSIFQQLIKTLKKGGRYLSGEDKLDLENTVNTMSQGIYDLFPITLKNSGMDYMDFIMGKIFSLDKNNRRCYCGAVGLVNRSFDRVIELYDGKLDFFAEKLPLSDNGNNFSLKENVPLMRCIDVFSLAGELNIRHKPICVFFSGGSAQSLSTLSRLTVFINVYVRRFQLISKEIARSYMSDYPLIEGLDYEEIARLLLIWLRGHDLGHFYGKDLLGEKVSELDKTYLILHELKSDMVSLYNLRHIADDLLEDDFLMKAYVVSIAEMFRYIRRGRFYNYPDTASAFLTYSYLKEHGSIIFHSKERRFAVDFEKLEADIESLTEEVFHIFAEGDVEHARELVNRWGNIFEIGQIRLPDELEILEDTGIPHFIDFNFITRDKMFSEK